MASLAHRLKTKIKCLKNVNIIKGNRKYNFKNKIKNKYDYVKINLKNDEMNVCKDKPIFFVEEISKKKMKKPKKNKLLKDAVMETSERVATEKSTDAEDANDELKSILQKCKKKNLNEKKTVSFTGVEDKIDNIVSNRKLRISRYKKLKKNKKRKLKKGKIVRDGQNDINNMDDNTVGPTRNIKALSYLEMWKNNKSNWKFEKLTQIWLLKHMFNIDEIPENSFQILLEYIVNMKGAGRDIASQYCHSVIKGKENKQNGAPNGDETENNIEEDIPYQRARLVLQCL